METVLIVLGVAVVALVLVVSWRARAGTRRAKADERINWPNRRK